MSNWVDKYKQLVIATHKPHIIVTDQDCLLQYVELKHAIKSEGFTIISAKSDLDVRVQFELKVRNAENKFLIIAPVNYSPLPDIEPFALFKQVGLSQLFPNLNGKAIQGLNYNALCLLSSLKTYEELGYEKTLKFLLENLYNVDFDALTSSNAKERLLNALISVFLEKNGINQSLSTFLEGITKPYFPKLVSNGLNKSNLIDFLQAQWQAFIDRNDATVDFSVSLLTKSLGYLFAFHYLKPVQVTSDKYQSLPKPLKIGVFVDVQGNNDNELEGFVEYLNQELGVIEDNVDQWFTIIQLIGEAKLRCLLSSNVALKDRFRKIENSLNVRFQRFVDNTYSSLFSLSGIRKPVVVTRILENLYSHPSQKKALLVIDGMNYWQWMLLGKKLSEVGISFSANATLAYIPTITAWSRQAIFKGDKPDLQADNSKEARLFESFWLKRKVPQHQIAYRKFSVNDPLSLDDISDDIKILGLVCNDLDDIMHGAVLGNDQLKTTTEQWINKSKILNIIDRLKEKGYQVFITADHGNVEATGIGNLTLKEKVGTLGRGKRHLQFANEVMLSSFRDQNPNLILGRKGLSVYLKENEAFTTGNSRVITHGGSHIWEVIVPFITIDGH